MPMAEDERGALYRNYASWKAWEGATAEGADAARYDDVFTIECRRAGLPANASVLEVGFGNGEFLDWCRAAGHRVYGVELIPELVERARAKGHEAVLCDGSPPRLADEQMFDLIAAFDVFEHFTADELCTWLAWMGAHLTRPEGRILARFPNGGSPFGRLYQSGDLTHRLTLSATSVDQLARLAGLRLVAAHNAARPLGGGRPKIAKRLAYAARDVIEIAVGYVYFSGRVPLDPNMTAVLARA